MPTRYTADDMALKCLLDTILSLHITLKDFQIEIKLMEWSAIIWVAVICINLKISMQ